MLLVDDTLAQRYVLMRTLEGAGFRVEQAASGSEALRIAHERADAVLLDVHLPDISGFDVARQLRKDPKTARLPILHISALHVSPEDRAFGLECGADDYLVHPFEPDELVERLTKLLEGRGA